MNKKIKDLRRQAHALKPVVIIGQQELSDTVQAEIDCALTAHELIKIRVNATDAEHRQGLIDAICTVQKATFVQKIGHVATIFRKNPDEAK